MTEQEKIRARVSTWVLTLAMLAVALFAHFSLKLRDEAVREAELYRQSLSQTNTAVVLINSHGIIEEWSEGATALLGWTRKEAVGGGPFFFIPDEMRSVHLEAFNHSMDGSEVGLKQQLKCEVKTKAGHRVKVLVEVSVFEKQGKRYAFGTMNRLEDIKERDLNKEKGP